MSTQKKIVVIGAVAYDHIMQYDGAFGNVLVPGKPSFSLSTHDRTVFYGGCGGNIAYNLRLLGADPALITVAGKDFDKYKAWLTKNDISSDHVYVLDSSMTASAFIVTDAEENQLCFFDLGAMYEINTTQSIRDVGMDLISYVMVAPDKPASMVRFAKECKELGVPYIFDPAQQMSLFEPEDLHRAVMDSHILIVNEYESELLSRMLKMSKEEIAAMPKMYIETLGAKGCRVMGEQGEHYVRAVTPSELVDPTGCGDAFRAGVLAGLEQEASIKEACQMGAVLATYCAENSGTQCHSFTLEAFAKRYEDSFGQPLQINMVQ